MAKIELNGVGFRSPDFPVTQNNQAVQISVFIKDNAAKNVANSTKQDMLAQMKNVRNIPTSASDSNNQGDSKPSASNQAFDAMLGLDNDVDNLFG